METIDQFVSKYHPISKNSLAEFENLFAFKQYKKNDVLYRSGESSARFFIMIKGIARSMVIDSNGKEKTRTLFQSPSVFTSLLSSLNNKPSIAEFNCLTNVSVFEGNFRKFLSLTSKFTMYENRHRKGRICRQK